MKANSIHARILIIVLSAANFLLLSNCARASAMQYTNEFWISTNATGNFYFTPSGTVTANVGTIDNPYDGSSQANFDTNMNSFPPNTTIHIMAGTYSTYGNDFASNGLTGFHVKSGQKILGSGVDVTTLVLASGPPCPPQ
jgi:hypothetical protein